jgi:hypothetical protein
VTDSIIVPLNTTQYTLELDNYLDEYVLAILFWLAAANMGFTRAEWRKS